LQSADTKTRNIGTVDQEFGTRSRSEEEFRAGRGFGAGGSSETMTSAYNGAGVVSSSKNDGHELVVSRDNRLTFSPFGVFAGLVHPDQPADPPQQILFINQPLQYFSLTQPANFSQV
jgi:hypothetical protein